MKKANLLACLLSPMLAIAQPQADSLRHLIHVKGPQVHLLAQMAEATATSHPDTALHYAQLARQRKAAGRDLITLEAATGEALMAQGQIEQSLKHFTQAYNQARQQTLQRKRTTNSVVSDSAIAACNTSIRLPSVMTK